ncbi:uracil-DNA glycosylase [Amnibacterium sp. CER49]|uniref:uracil-DNA glycosylase n=1 Tax=Amnibacterium sp. CER49 TaxID=3039161 RepID=UPI002447667A|nr:uracil-DNA glycosylase [Amnibacterium sp. CER49]MDH2445231.1 uracil-DNA glycosylase [Amnibacterium sp. CER49]
MSVLGLADLAAEGRIDPGWADALAPAEPALLAALAFLDTEEAAGHRVLPARDHVLRAFTTPLERVRVLILGQDPYPTPSHPIGLAFAVERHVRPLPRSLVNIYRERESDLGIPPAAHGDLSAWADQGVLLLNRDLTVRAGAANSHRGKGWEPFTTVALQALARRGGPLVAILWGRQAQALGGLLGDVPRLESAHPSPLSARNGFFGSRPFSRTNALLEEQGAAPLDWRLPGDPGTAEAAD